jgi:hypothetical protein
MQEAFMRRLAGMAVAALVAGVAWSGNAFAQAKIVDGPEVRWKLAAWGKPRAGTANVETLRKFMDERTGGKFKIQIGYESFGQPKELLDLLKVGSLEMTNICASYHPEKLPVYSALDLPLPADRQHRRAGEGAQRLPQASARDQGDGGLEGHALPVGPAAQQRVRRPAARRPRRSRTSRACACVPSPASARRCASSARCRPRSTRPRSIPRSSAARSMRQRSRRPMRISRTAPTKSASGTPRT